MPDITIKNFFKVLYGKYFSYNSTIIFTSNIHGKNHKFENSDFCVINMVLIIPFNVNNLSKKPFSLKTMNSKKCKTKITKQNITYGILNYFIIFFITYVNFKLLFSFNAKTHPDNIKNKGR